MSTPTLNVVTRVGTRPQAFQRCRFTVRKQTYPEVLHICGTEDDNAEGAGWAAFAGKHISYRRLTEEDDGNYFYNRYLNRFTGHVKDGYVMYLDDDDQFMRETAAAEIVEAMEAAGAGLGIWKVRFPQQCVPKISFGYVPTLADVSGIGFCWRTDLSKYVWWQQCFASDFYCIHGIFRECERQGVPVLWIDKVLTGVQRRFSAGGGGSREDFNESDRIDIARGTFGLPAGPSSSAASLHPERSRPAVDAAGDGGHP